MIFRTGLFLYTQYSTMTREYLFMFCPGRVLSLCSLLPHEQKMSVLNIAVRRSPLSRPNPVKSKVLNKIKNKKPWSKLWDYSLLFFGILWFSGFLVEWTMNLRIKTKKRSMNSHSWSFLWIIRSSSFNFKWTISVILRDLPCKERWQCPIYHVKNVEDNFVFLSRKVFISVNFSIAIYMLEMRMSLSQ